MHPNNATKISLKHLSFFYGDFRALDDISFDVRKNEIFGLMGPAKSGKSTLLRVLNRMSDLVPTAKVTGRVTLDGEDILAPTYDLVALRRRVGLVLSKPMPFTLIIIVIFVAFFGAVVAILLHFSKSRDPIERRLRDVRDGGTGSEGGTGAPSLLVAMYQAATRLAPEDAAYLRLLALFCAQNNANIANVGVPAAQKGVALEKDNADNLDLLGWLLMLDRRYEYSKQVLEQALDVDPNYASAHLHLGMLYAEVERPRYSAAAPHDCPGSGKCGCGINFGAVFSVTASEPWRHGVFSFLSVSVAPWFNKL